MSGSDWKKLLAFGSGLGIEIGSRDLRVAAVRVRPSGAKILETVTLSGFHSRPAGEWGAEYAAFVRRLGVAHLAASVLLPREEVIVRLLPLAGVADRDLAGAVALQMDTLHPYPEDDVVSAWVRVPGTSTVLVAISRRETVDDYARLFTEAGVKVFTFTASAAVLHSALRLFATPPVAGFLTYQPREDEDAASPDFEIYGESPARPVFSATFEAPRERACALALAELRIEGDQPPVPLAHLLPPPLAAPGGLDLSRNALAYAAALADACPRLALSLNLLPAELRVSTSRTRFVPSLVLASLVVLAAGALWGYGKVENIRFQRSLQAEIDRVEPRARMAASLERQIQDVRGRTQLLDSVRRRSKQDMDALRELTRVLPPPTWVSALDMTRTSVTMMGETDTALPLLKAIDASPLFDKSEFIGAPAKIPTGESFHIRTQREGGGQ